MLTVEKHTHTILKSVSTCWESAPLPTDVLSKKGCALATPVNKAANNLDFNSPPLTAFVNKPKYV